MTRIIQPDRRPTAGAYCDPIFSEFVPRRCFRRAKLRRRETRSRLGILLSRVKPLPGEGIVENVQPAGARAQGFRHDAGQIDGLRFCQRPSGGGGSHAAGVWPD